MKPLKVHQPKLRQDRDPLLTALFEAWPGMQAALANSLGVTRQAVSVWNRIPKKHLTAVANLLELPEIGLPSGPTRKPRRKPATTKPE